MRPLPRSSASANIYVGECALSLSKGISRYCSPCDVPPHNTTNDRLIGAFGQHSRLYAEQRVIVKAITNRVSRYPADWWAPQPQIR